MQIIAHRGLWKDEKEKNTIRAFTKAFDLGFGIETDIRDYHSKLVISHDLPKGNEPEFKEVLDVLDKRKLPLALNIKADGLAHDIHNLCVEYGIESYFVFDMSIPDMLNQIIAKNIVFSRMSEVEPEPFFSKYISGIWLDSFFTEWYDEITINNIVNKYKYLSIVSPELHNRDKTLLWNTLDKYINNDKILLCTDFPELAFKRYVR